jgi:hypothetical protein
VRPPGDDEQSRRPTYVTSSKVYQRYPWGVEKWALWSLAAHPRWCGRKPYAKVRAATATTDPAADAAPYQQRSYRTKKLPAGYATAFIATCAP